MASSRTDLTLLNELLMACYIKAFVMRDLGLGLEKTLDIRFHGNYIRPIATNIGKTSQFYGLNRKKKRCKLNQYFHITVNGCVNRLFLSKI